MIKYTDEEFTELARYLQECGCAVQSQHRLKLRLAGLSIQQLPNAGVNMAFDLEDGRSGYLMDMHVMNETKRPIRSGGIHITTPWCARVSLLPDASESDIYDFPNESLTISKSVVLNDFLSGRGELSPGSGISGLLLGIDEEPLPSSLPEHGLTVVELEIFDEGGNGFSSQFRLCVDRSATFARERSRKTNRRRIITEAA
jgi:hypothetical protein